MTNEEIKPMKVTQIILLHKTRQLTGDERDNIEKEDHKQTVIKTQDTTRNQEIPYKHTISKIDKKKKTSRTQASILSKQ